MTEDQNQNTEHRVIKLLKKGQKGFFRAVFSRLGLMAIAVIIQFGILFAGFVWFGDRLPHYFGSEIVFTLVIVIYLINSRIDPTSKITWLLIISVVPIFGALLLVFTKSDIGHRALKARINQIAVRSKDEIRQDDGTASDFAADYPAEASLGRYLLRCGGYPVCRDTDVTYFPSGEAKFEELIRRLEEAREFIFLEYFIIDEGIMWGTVLDILVRKAAEGVEVRLMYDGTCEFSTLSHDYPKRLAALGIKCKIFAPVSPFVSTHYNYRDHRKILVIDGKVAFTGGVNLADEYINLVRRHGHWKDTAIMLRGEAVRSFTLMFLRMWAIEEKHTEYDRYIKNITFPKLGSEFGYVIPYGDCPLDGDKTGERVYMDILNRARRYVHIMSPYLVLDGEMETALKFAAERGVDVTLILPGIPDKKAPYALAKTHYASLLDSGVKIYEYTPGFVHAKVFVSDDTEAVVGTINLDYRSLYHHFECAAYLCGCPCISDIKADFEETLQKCRQVTRETVKKEKVLVKLQGYMMKAIAPLL